MLKALQNRFASLALPCHRLTVACGWPAIARVSAGRIPGYGGDRSTRGHFANAIIAEIRDIEPSGVIDDRLVRA